MSQRSMVECVGTIVGEPVFAYRSNMHSFYSIKLAVCRLSSACDVLPVYLFEEQLFPFVACKQRVLISGELRSYSQVTGEKRRLIVYIQAYRICPTEHPDENRVCLQGYVVKPPILRRTPFGKEICDILLLVRRNANKSDTVPIIAWNTMARRTVHLCAGDTLCIEGRFQSREYEKRFPNGDCLIKTTYEVSCSDIVT